METNELNWCIDYIERFAKKCIEDGLDGMGNHKLRHTTSARAELATIAAHIEHLTAEKEASWDSACHNAKRAEAAESALAKAQAELDEWRGMGLSDALKHSQEMREQAEFALAKAQAEVERMRPVVEVVNRICFERDGEPVTTGEMIELVCAGKRCKMETTGKAVSQ